MSKNKLTGRIHKTIQRIDKLNNKVNPLNQKVDKKNTTDTGTESVKMLNSELRSGKKAVKTVNSGIKTTKRTIKTVKNAPTNIKRAGKAAYKTGKATVKVVKVTVSVLTKVVSHFAAAIANPVFLVIFLIILLIIYVIVNCIFVLGGSAAGEAQNKRAYSEAAGLENVPEQFKQGLEVLNKCRDEKKIAYEKWIDELYYDYNNRRESDLVYMERYSKDNVTTSYQTSLAYPEEKQVLKNALDWSLGIDDYEILSIAYVLAEKEKNNIRDSEYAIRDVKYTAELINKVIDDKVVKYYTSGISEGQMCPGNDCCERIELTENPDYKKYEDQLNKYKQAYNEWYTDVVMKIYTYLQFPMLFPPDRLDDYIAPAITDWKNKYEWDSIRNTYYTPYYNRDDIGYSFYTYLLNDIQDFYIDKLNNTNQYNETVIKYCDCKHKLHARGLVFFSKENIMDLLGFDEVDKYWEELTEMYLRTIPEEEENDEIKNTETY